MAEYYAVPHDEMEEFLRQRRFVPVELSYRNRPVKEWVYERKLPRSPGHWVRIYTGINRYGKDAGDSRKSGKDAIRVQVIYRDGLGETLVSQPKRVHRVSGWAENLDKRLKEVAEKLPRVAYDSRGQPMTLRKGKSGYFWGSRDYPRYKETRPFQAEEDLEVWLEEKIQEINSLEELKDIFSMPLRSKNQPKLLRINFPGVYATRVIRGPAQIIYGRNMLCSLGVSTNIQYRTPLMEPMMKKFHEPKLYEMVPNNLSQFQRSVSLQNPVVAFTEYANIDGLRKASRGEGGFRKSGGKKNLMIVDLEGVTIINDPDGMWHYENDKLEQYGWEPLRRRGEIEILGGVPQENVVYQQIKPEYNYQQKIGDRELRWSFSKEWHSESAPLAGQTTEAPYEIKVYVPSTDLDQPVSETEFQSRIDETQEKLSELFGGFTTTEGDGGYLSQEDGLISEPVMIVTTWANPEEYLDKLKELETFLQDKQQDWGQEVIGFEFENDFFMFPEFSAEGDPAWMSDPEKKRTAFLKLQKEDGVPRICEVCESAYSGLYRYSTLEPTFEVFVVCRNCVKKSEREWGDIFGIKPDWTGERAGKPSSVIHNVPDVSAGSILLISGAIGFAMGMILGR